jgi:hypothetical protein
MQLRTLDVLRRSCTMGAGLISSSMAAARLGASPI